MNVKSVLITTDLSQHSLVVFDVLKKYFNKNTKVHLLHIVPSSISPIYGGTIDFLNKYEGWDDEITKEANESLESIAKKYLKEFDYTHQIKQENGSVSKGIVRYADENEVDLILISTHGRGALEGILLGSTTQRVLQNSKIPVLAVPYK